VSILTIQKAPVVHKDLVEVINLPLVSQQSSESIYFQLSKAERRLYSVITEYETVKSPEIRFLASVGNIAQLAKRINIKLAENGDLRQLVSTRKSVINEAGRSEVEYTWSLNLGGAAQ
jgi:hypothetical protein